MPECTPHQSLPARRRAPRGARGSATVMTAGVLLLGGLPGGLTAASAAEDENAHPSQREVDAARERVAETARSVEAIRADLAAASADLDRLAVAAAKAAEAYNGARWRLEQARATADQAKVRADRQSRRLDRQRNQIGALVASTYQQGSSFGQVNAYLGSDDPQALLDRMSAFKGASDSLASDYDRFAAQSALAQVFRRQAREAVAEADRAAAEAEQAKQAAASAVAAQQAAVASLGERRDALIAELAEAQGISVELARQRQEALERIEAERRARAAEAAAEARRKAEERRRAELAAQERAAQERATQERAAHERAAQERAAQERAAQERVAAERAAEERAAERRATRHREAVREAAEREARERREREARERREREARERREREAAERARESSPPPQSGGAEAAVDFAYAQLGEPYAWGADGPGSWDCSGLTMRAWEAGGRSLSHYSVAQYYETSRISAGDLRRGDLIFWSDNGAPSGIFHVAIYVGDGQMIHAPNSSRPVTKESVWYWRAPDFYGRV